MSENRIQCVEIELEDGRRLYFSGFAHDDVAGYRVVSVKFTEPRELPPDVYLTTIKEALSKSENPEHNSIKAR